MTTFKFILICVQLLRKAVAYMEKQGIIRDEQRRELLRQLQLTAGAVKIKEKNIAEVSKLDEKQVDNALAGDFRD